MKKKIFLILILIIGIGLVSGCSRNHSTKKEEKQTNEKGEISTMKITINSKTYPVHLEENETTKELLKLLPLELEMNELNGNEKYTYLNTSLPTNSKNPKEINKGDIYLFGDNCLVLFYKSFKTSYSYTKIGYIDNLEDFGNENIQVRIEK